MSGQQHRRGLAEKQEPTYPPSVQCPGDHNFCNLTKGAGGWGNCARPDEAGGPKNPRNLCYVPLCQVWARPLEGGAQAVALYNADDRAHNITVNFHALGWPDADAVQLHDVWAATARGSFSRRYTAAVEPHGVVLLRATNAESPAAGAAARTVPIKADDAPASTEPTEFPAGQAWHPTSRHKSDDGEPSSSGVYLLTPDLVDEEHTTMVRRVGRLAKDEQPVIRQEHPWENAIFLCGQSVVEVGSELHMYYTTHTGERGSMASVLCLAKSADGGKTWTKPQLGLVEYAGSKANNIVIAEIGNGGNVFVDDNPSVPADERFKFTSTAVAPLALYVSPDGIHFTKRGAVAGIWSRVGDTQPSLMWDARSQHYLMYGRIDASIDAVGPSQEARRCGKGSVNGHTVSLSAVRNVGFSQAANLSVAPPTDHRGTWTNVSLALGLPPSTDGDMDCAVGTYNSATVMVHKAFIMMPSQFLHDGTPTFPYSPSGGRPADGVLDVRLAISGNAPGPFSWLDETFIPRGIGRLNTSATGSHWHYTGEWDAGYIFAVRGYYSTATRTTVFYMGSQNTHGNYPTIWTYTNATTAIGRATMRKDGWWSFDAEGAGEKTLRTMPLRLPSAPVSIWVNMESSVRGSLRVEVLDATTLQPLLGLALNDSVPLMGNYVRQQLSWRSSAALRVGAGRSVRLRFVVLSAKLFSFEVSG
jgi:hypothetical protein